LILQQFKHKRTAELQCSVKFSLVSPPCESWWIVRHALMRSAWKPQDGHHTGHYKTGHHRTMQLDRRTILDCEKNVRWN